VKDIRATCDELSRQGVEVGEPQPQPWSTIHAEFSDPEGNRWTLQQPAVRDQGA
jgi:uncharacterized glyoxalase superfamily protein PhnB